MPVRYKPSGEGCVRSYHLFSSIHGVLFRRILFTWTLVFLAGVGLATEQTARAQYAGDPSDPYRFIAWTVGDGRAFGGHVASRKALYAAAGLGGLVVVLSGQDEPLTDGAADLAEHTYPPVRRIANEIGNVKVVQPMALMLFLGSLTSERTRFQDAAFTSLEAIILANFISDALKGLVGRARPYQQVGAHHFRPLSGNTSFPSGHATTVFAFTTPWLFYYHDYRTIGIFLMGAGTAFTRMIEKQHWFTDVVAGTAIGFTTGYWLTRRHQGRAGGLEVTPVIARGGAGIHMRIRL